MSKAEIIRELERGQQILEAQASGKAFLGMGREIDPQIFIELKKQRIIKKALAAPGCQPWVLAF